MTTPTDTDDPPAPDSRSALLANKPERCNTKIIDPALLADIVPQAPPESRRPISESASAAAQERPRAASQRPPEAAIVAATNGPDETPPSPIPPTAKTMVVAYAPRPARSPQRTVGVVALLLAGLALGVAAWFGLKAPASQAPGAAPAQPDKKIAFGEGPPEAFTEQPRAAPPGSTAAQDSTAPPGSTTPQGFTAPPDSTPSAAMTASVLPTATQAPSSPAAPGARSSAPPASTPGTHPTARPATPTTSSHAPAAPSTTTMVFPSD